MMAFHFILSSQVCRMTDNLPTWYYLFYVDGDVEDGSDWIYIVVANIVTTHNELVESSRRQVPIHLKRLFPNQPSEASPIEITTDIYNLLCFKNEAFEDDDTAPSHKM